MRVPESGKECDRTPTPASRQQESGGRPTVCADGRLLCRSPDGRLAVAARGRGRYRSDAGMWIAVRAQQSHARPPRFTFQVTYSLSPAGSTAVPYVPTGVQPYFCW